MNFPNSLSPLGKAPLSYGLSILVLTLWSLQSVHSETYLGENANGTFAKIIFTKNRVTYSKDGKNFQTAKKGMTLGPGHLLKTQERSFAILDFPQNSKIKLEENSLIQVQELANRPNSNQAETSQFFLEFGRALIEFVNRIPQKRLRVETPSFSASIRGTKFYISTQAESEKGDRSGDYSALAVQNGEVVVTSKKTEQKKRVRAHEGLLVNNQTGELSEVKNYPWVNQLPWQFQEGPAPTSTDNSQRDKNSESLNKIFAKACAEKNVEACTHLSLSQTIDNTSLQPRDLVPLKDHCLKGSTYSCFYLGQFQRDAQGQVAILEKNFLQALSGPATPSGVSSKTGDKGESPSPAALAERCFQKDKKACFDYGQRMGPMDGATTETLQHKTGHRLELYKILAVECGKNNVLACSSLSQYLPHKRGSATDPSTADDQLLASEDGPQDPSLPPRGTGRPTNRGLDAQALGNMEACRFEEPPTLVKLKGDRDAGLCVGNVQCASPAQKDLASMLVACTANGDRCPQALPCLQDESVDMTAPANEAEFKHP